MTYVPLFLWLFVAFAALNVQAKLNRPGLGTNVSKVTTIKANEMTAFFSFLESTLPHTHTHTNKHQKTGYIWSLVMTPWLGWKLMYYPRILSIICLDISITKISIALFESARCENVVPSPPQTIIKTKKSKKVDCYLRINGIIMGDNPMPTDIAILKMCALSISSKGWIDYGGIGRFVTWKGQWPGSLIILKIYRAVYFI